LYCIPNGKLHKTIYEKIFVVRKILSGESYVGVISEWDEKTNANIFKEEFFVAETSLPPDDFSDLPFFIFSLM